MQGVLGCLPTRGTPPNIVLISPFPSFALGMDHLNAYQDEMQSLELTISRFLSGLIPVHQLSTQALTTEDQCTLYTTHTLAQAAFVHLYQRFAQSDPVAYEKCSRAAREIVSVIKHVGDAVILSLDPIVGVSWKLPLCLMWFSFPCSRIIVLVQTCWASAASILIRELDSFEASWPGLDTAELRGEIGTIMWAMNTLGVRFPVVGKYPSSFTPCFVRLLTDCVFVGLAAQRVQKRLSGQQ